MYLFTIFDSCTGGQLEEGGRKFFLILDLRDHTARFFFFIFLFCYLDSGC